MKTPQNTNPPAEPEAEPTMRALDPFFETRDMRDHANQWHIDAIWSDEKATPKPSQVDSR
jgi:hypothetical protein